VDPWQTGPIGATAPPPVVALSPKRTPRGISIAAMTLSAVNAGAAALMLALSYHMATNNALQFYSSTRYIMYQAAAGVFIGILGAAIRLIRFPCLLLSSAAIAALIVPCWLAEFPGGDDGGGFGWIFIVGGACLVSLGIGLATGAAGLVLGIIALARRHG
jgi:hypothetical protein